MIKQVVFLLACTFVYSSFGQNISVSGISSGGYMAVQYHVAFSRQIVGAGIVAGGPYWCSNANVQIALSSCMEYPSLISLSELYAATAYAASFYSIDPTSNIANTPVYLYSGTKDTVVDPGVVKKLQQYYAYYGAKVKTNYAINSEHAFITNDYGNSCGNLGSPYINNCGFDLAGAILQTIYGNLSPAVTAKPNNIITIDQSQFIPAPFTGYGIGMDSTAFAYVSTGCQKKSPSCKLHIAFHGCLQTLENIGSIFHEYTGYNEWAESNNMIILYPQAMANALNPEGCWDWWGYSGLNFATKTGPQMATVQNMQQYIVKKYF